MRTCWVPVPRHAAKIGEIMQVLWSDFYGAALFGDEGEIAILPHKRCRLEIVATAESSHPELNLVLPGQVLRYKGSFCFLDRFELPSGTTVGLWHLVSFKLRLVSDTIAPVPSEDAVLDRARGISLPPALACPGRYRDRSPSARHLVRGAQVLGQSEPVGTMVQRRRYDGSQSSRFLVVEGMVPEKRGGTRAILIVADEPDLHATSARLMWRQGSGS